MLDALLKLRELIAANNNNQILGVVKVTSHYGSRNVFKFFYCHEQTAILL
jgi:hypothetical protein